MKLLPSFLSRLFSRKSEIPPTLLARRKLTDEAVKGICKSLARCVHHGDKTLAKIARRKNRFRTLRILNTD